MFQALSNKVITGVVYLSMVLFSSYEGNIAYFDKLESQFFNDKLLIRTQLLSAFQNDFEEMFKSGQPINIYFNIEVKENNNNLHNHQFMHSVKFDPMSQVFYVLLEEKSTKYRLIEEYDTMIDLISNIEYTCDIGNTIECNLTLEANLETIKLNSLDKDFDMMLLWKYKRPKLKEKIKKAEYEN